MAEKSAWTPEKLAELIALFPKLTPKRLIEKYQTSIDEINRIYLFAIDEQRLRIEQITITPGNGHRDYRLTKYAAHRATGNLASDLADDPEEDSIWPKKPL